LIDVTNHTARESAARTAVVARLRACIQAVLLKHTLKDYAKDA
jgi:hypothetical protein